MKYSAMHTLVHKGVSHSITLRSSWEGQQSFGWRSGHSTPHGIYSATLVWNQQLVRILDQHHMGFWNKRDWKHFFLPDPLCQQREVFSFEWRALLKSSTVTLTVVYYYIWISFAWLFKKNKQPKVHQYLGLPFSSGWSAKVNVKITNAVWNRSCATIEISYLLSLIVYITTNSNILLPDLRIHYTNKLLHAGWMKVKLNFLLPSPACLFSFSFNYHISHIVSCSIYGLHFEPWIKYLKSIFSSRF